MIVSIKTSMTDTYELDTEGLIYPEEPETSRYNKYTDKKWIKFCRDHGFSRLGDVNTKIYELYLELCANGMI